jgi:hypothetical protein
MAINTHLGCSIQSTKCILVGRSKRAENFIMNGWTYDTGWRYGIGRAEEFEKTWWPRVERYLAEIDYPFPMIMVQSYHPFGDNGSAYGSIPVSSIYGITREAAAHCYGYAKMWWAALQEHSLCCQLIVGLDRLLELGCISGAHEQA